MQREESLEAQVMRIRIAVLERHGIELGGAIPSVRDVTPIEDAQRLATVSAHWGIASDLPFVGRFLVLFRRVMRILLRWYINPIVEQQNAFNHAAVRALYDLQAENDHLRAELDRRIGRSELHHR
jgi:hypothetical protein